MSETAPKRKAGRPKGTLGIASRERMRMVAQSDVKPLDVLMQTMSARWKSAQAEADPARKIELEHAACAVAEKVAPYLHPKLQATTLKGDAANPLTLTLALASAEVLKGSVR